jgi:hypothetical protein
MSILTQDTQPVKLGDAILWQLDREDMQELADYAGRWAWHVYDRIVEVLGDHDLAAKTARKVQEKIINGNGTACS